MNLFPNFRLCYAWKRKGPGGPRGLQNRCPLTFVSGGGFDSHALPNVFFL